MFLVNVASTMICRMSANSHQVTAAQVRNTLIDLAVMHAARRTVLALTQAMLTIAVDGTVRQSRQNCGMLRTSFDARLTSTKA